MACPLVLPKTLQWTDTSHNGLKIADIPEIVLLGNTSLKYLNASYCGLRTIVYPLYCAWNVTLPLETIDLSNNNLQCVNASVFNKAVFGCDWSSLKHLYIGSNKLGNSEGNVCNKDKSNVLRFLESLNNLSFGHFQQQASIWSETCQFRDTDSTRST